VLLVAVVLSFVYVIRKRMTGNELPLPLAVSAGFAAAALPMVASALRAMEYAVPLCLFFVASTVDTLISESVRSHTSADRSREPDYLVFNGPCGRRRPPGRSIDDVSCGSFDDQLNAL